MYNVEHTDAAWIRPLPSDASNGFVDFGANGSVEGGCKSSTISYQNLGKLIYG